MYSARQLSSCKGRARGSVRPTITREGDGGKTACYPHHWAHPRHKWEYFSSERIDYQGVANAAAAAKLTGIEKVVHVTCNGVDSPQRWFVRFLNYMSGMGLGWKLKGDNALRASGVAYVVVRPVGLKNKDHDKPVVMKQCAPYEWGACMVSRETVGEVCAQALVHAPGCVTLNCREDLNATPSDTWSQTFDWTRAFGKLQCDAGPIPATFEDHVRCRDR